MRQKLRRLATASRRNSRWCSSASCPSSTNRCTGTQPLQSRRSRREAEASLRPPLSSGLPAGTQGRFLEKGCRHHSQQSSGAPGNSTRGLHWVYSPSASSSEETRATGGQGRDPLASPLGWAVGAAGLTLALGRRTTFTGRLEGLGCAALRCSPPAGGAAGSKAAARASLAARRSALQIPRRAARDFFFFPGCLPERASFPAMHVRTGGSVG